MAWFTSETSLTYSKSNNAQICKTGNLICLIKHNTEQKTYVQPHHSKHKSLDSPGSLLTLLGVLLFSCGTGKARFEEGWSRIPFTFISYLTNWILDIWYIESFMHIYARDDRVQLPIYVYIYIYRIRIDKNLFDIIAIPKTFNSQIRFPKKTYRNSWSILWGLLHSHMEKRVKRLLSWRSSLPAEQPAEHVVPKNPIVISSPTLINMFGASTIFRHIKHRHT